MMLHCVYRCMDEIYIENGIASELKAMANIHLNYGEEKERRRRQGE